jgi:thiamine biosynthesis lipoprotein
VDEARRLIRRGHWWTLWFAALAGAGAAAEPVAAGGRALGTTWSLRWVPGPGTPDPTLVQREATALLEAFESELSAWRPDSALNRLNAAPAGEWLLVSPRLAGIVADALVVAALTGGAFDPTVEPLLGPWGHGPAARTGPPPPPAELERLRSSVDWRRLEVRADPPAVRRARADTRIDLSSPAKGRATDELSDLALRLGAPNHLAAVGGDLRAAGPGPTGAGWPVGIATPGAATAAVARRLNLRDAALSTSGNDRNRAPVGPAGAGHLLDPRTGRPAENGLLSVSVRATTSQRASALATGLFVLGPAAGPALADAASLPSLFLANTPAGTLTAQATGSGWEPEIGPVPVSPYNR